LRQDLDNEMGLAGIESEEFLKFLGKTVVPDSSSTVIVNSS
jgi:hypothetical protein